VGLFFIPLGVLAVIFGIISVAKTTAKGLGIAGIIIGGVSLIITIIMSVVLGVLIGTAATEINTNYDQYYNELNEINQILEDYDYNYNY
jgi:ABC-type transport system involved in multi-copper enzyme maturation permease subunit